MTIQSQHSTKINSLVSVTKLRFIFLLEICVVLLILSLAGTLSILGNTEPLGPVDDSYTSSSLASSGNIAGVPYVWQQTNGFCYWATLSMALQSIGINHDLAEVSAATGIGFSSSYLRYDDTLLLLSGSSYKQQSILDSLSELLGFDVEFYMDSDTTDWAHLFSLTLESFNVNWTEIDGWDGAFQVLKNSIDSGFPVAIYANLQNLPAEDYDLFRTLGVTDPTPTHSILVTGYNETAGTAQIMDPAIGLFDDPATYPDDGSWLYEIDFTSLNQSWLASYATTIIKPGQGVSEDFELSLATYIVDRLRGDRNSYSPDAEEVFFWNFGSDAFRAMASDLTETGLSSFMDEFDDYDLQTRSIILQGLAIELETRLTQQHQSYRVALNALPRVLPSLDLEDFVSAGEPAIEHLEVFSDNSTVNTPFYPSGIKLVTKTFFDIASEYENDGDLSSAIAMYEENLAEIRTHLNAIANAWDAAADALERELTGPDYLLSSSLSGLGVISLLAIAIHSKRRRESGN
ncbi:MAG: C39 family peptidase [Candidatus Thorarchaeota archaeon]